MMSAMLTARSSRMPKLTNRLRRCICETAVSSEPARCLSDRRHSDGSPSEDLNDRRQSAGLPFEDLSVMRQSAGLPFEERLGSGITCPPSATKPDISWVGKFSPGAAVSKRGVEPWATKFGGLMIPGGPQFPQRTQSL